MRPMSLVGRTHMHRLTGTLVALLAVAFAVGIVWPAQAAEQVKSLPFVNNFATARFKLLGTSEIQGLTLKSFGEGTTVLPDRTSAWVGTDGSKTLSYVVQIGNTTYQRVGTGDWKQAKGMSNLNAQPVSAQFNLLQQYATSITKIGVEPVGNVSTTHYQVLLDGDKALQIGGGSNGLTAEQRDYIAKAVFKYDFWIGGPDSFLYQQNIEITLPATKLSGQDIPAIRSATLLTFYDINDPTISISAPK